LNAYDKGKLARLTVSFTNFAGTAVDPTTVALSYRKSNGVQATVTLAGGAVVRESLGNFYYDLTLDVAGVWHYRWVSTGEGQAAEVGSLLVKSNPLEATDP
jgi:hypothetical protein